jgi:hypothetical protein
MQMEKNKAPDYDDFLAEFYKKKLESNDMQCDIHV